MAGSPEVVWLGLAMFGSAEAPAVLARPKGFETWARALMPGAIKLAAMAAAAIVVLMGDSPSLGSRESPVRWLRSRWGSIDR